MSAFDPKRTSPALPVSLFDQLRCRLLSLGAYMRRREFLSVLGGAAAAWPLSARIQQATPASRIGWLSTGSPTSHRLSLSAFREGLRALGYIEGGNLAIEYRWAEGNLARLPELASQLVQQQVEVILAGGSTGAQAAKEATSVIPIIAAGTGDLVELGLVTSFARPGGNLTGFITAAPETAGKRLQIITEIAPQARRAAVLWTPGATHSGLEWKVVSQLASTLGLALEPLRRATCRTWTRHWPQLCDPPRGCFLS